MKPIRCPRIAVAPTKRSAFRRIVQMSDFKEREQFYYERFDAAVEEDRTALENQQRGMNSPFTQPGRYATLMEPSVASFASWYATQLQTE